MDGMMEGFYSHTCNYCNKVFESYSNLLEHKKTHVGDRPFSCHICHKRFTQKAHLNIHKRTHTGEKPYPCHICHKRFAQSSHLNSHRRIHAGDRPYFCVVCNTGFSQKHRFDAHLPCMQQAQSRSSARISAAVAAAAVSMQASAAMASYSGGPRKGEGSGGSQSQIRNHLQDDDVADQKPDIRYLEALNQQALMQQLAEFSTAGADITKSYSGDTGSQEGRQSGNESRPSTEFVSQREEDRGSYYQRKPALVHHANNEERSNSTFRRNSVQEAASAHRTNTSLTEPDEDDEATDEDGEDEEDEDEPKVYFQNGAKAPGNPYAQTQGSQGHSMTTRSSQGYNSGSKTSPAAGALPANQSVLPTRVTPIGAPTPVDITSGQNRNSQTISLLNFTADELISHLMSRQDVHRCDFCRLIFQDAAMYHIHRNMHDKNDLRCCNLCGKMMHDKYDFTAHFLNEHQS